MKKRNFILDFALKSKYNFFACLVALLVLIFSVSSITYAWIEGATTLTINSPTGNKVFDDNLLAFNITSADDNTNTIKIDPYIDPQVVCLAPATGTVVDNEIQVKFSGRDASTNDISNNYLFFEAKIKCVDLVTGFAFTGDSSIKIGQNSVSGIKTGVTVLDASDRTPIASKITDAPDLPGAIAVDGLTDEPGEYILQFKIWNETGVDTYNGEEVAVNLTLTTQKAATTIYLKDYTNSSTTDNALNGKTLQIKSGDVVIPVKLTKSADNITYVFKNVPDKYLDNLTFEALNSDTSVYASWCASLSKDVTTYYVYGDPTKSLGTYDGVQQVTFSDASYENLLKIDAQDVTIDNGVALSESTEYYVMHKMSDTKYTAYVPVGTSSTPGGSESKTITFSNGIHSVTAKAFRKSNPYYYIFGATETVNTDGTTECLGFWTTSSTVLSDNVLPITIKDYSKTNLNSNGFSVYVSYPGFGSDEGVPYKAYYDAAANAWKINSYYSDKFSSAGKVWLFKATDGTTVHSWTDSTTNNRPDGKTTYYFTSANVASSAGTWDYKDSLIDTDILTGAKVSFYAGFESSWGNTIYINEDSGSTVVRTASQASADTPFLPINKDGKNYSAAKFTLPSLEYYISNKAEITGNDGWTGKKIGEKAEGGKFYGIYAIDVKNQGVATISPVEGTTTIGGQNSSDTTPVSVPKGSTSVAFATSTTGDNSVVNSPLYVEYYICHADSVADKDAYECLNPYSPTANPKGTAVSSNSAGATLDLSAYLQDNTYVIKTVLTDGAVYYVADTDYITISAPPEKRKVTLNAVQGGDGTAKVEYTGGSITTAGGSADISELTDITITVTPDTSTENYVFDRIEICEGDTVIETINSNSGTYKIPVKADHPDITIKPYVKVQSKITVYFKNTARWSSPIYAYTWEPENKNFPGAQMTLVEGETDVYYIELAADTYSNILFTNKADGSTGSQTTNTTIPADLTERNMFICNPSANTSDPDKDKFGGTWDKYTPKVYKSVNVKAPEGVTIKATPEGGIDQTVDANTTETFSVEQGKTITLVATPTVNKGYYDVVWSGVGSGQTESDHEGSSNYTPTIDKSVADGTEITVAFSNHAYELTYTDDSRISATAKVNDVDVNISSGAHIAENTIVTLKFVDNESANNVSWTGAAAAQGPNLKLAGETDTYEVTMDDNKDITLTAKKLYKVTYSINGAANSTLSSDLSTDPVDTATVGGSAVTKYVPNNTAVTFTVTKPDAENYYAVDWKTVKSTSEGDETGTLSGGSVKSAKETNNYTITADTTVEVTVTKSSTYAVTIKKPTNATFTKANYQVGSAGVVNILNDVNNADTTVYLPKDAKVEVEATANTNYKFESFTVNTDTITDNPATVTVGTDAVTISVNVSELPTDTIYFKNSENWSDVFVNFYSKAYWNDSNGTGANKEQGFVTSHQMTIYDEANKIYQYKLTDDLDNDLTHYSIVAFTSKNQTGYGNFWDNNSDSNKIQVVYRQDFDISYPLFTIDSTSQKELNTAESGGAIYYLKGTWSTLSGEPKPAVIDSVTQSLADKPTEKQASNVLLFNTTTAVKSIWYWTTGGGNGSYQATTDTGKTYNNKYLYYYQTSDDNPNAIAYKAVKSGNWTGEDKVSGNIEYDSSKVYNGVFYCNTLDADKDIKWVVFDHLGFSSNALAYEVRPEDSGYVKVSFDSNLKTGTLKDGATVEYYATDGTNYYLINTTDASFTWKKQSGSWDIFAVITDPYGLESVKSNVITIT